MKQDTINVKRTIRNIILIDTETIGSIYLPEASLPFDISVKWYDMKNKKVLRKKCYLVRRFINNKYIMHGSFSASKYKYYLEQIKNNKDYFVGSVKDIMQDIAKYNKKYKIKVATAYNDRFDKNKINQLCYEFGIDNSIKELKWFDLMKLGKEIATTKEYQNFCLDNANIMKHEDESKFLTKKGNIRTTAESIYCYMINNPHFVENHTGLEDLKIELSILEYARKHNKQPILPLTTIA